ncbi:hypothetical protein N6G96_07180 [Pediococcus inopinatus]|uniref:Uncharacterized protein n=1 Tax=Pediococcus inopinatus TaxID=114090 RepID=A0ABZ0Q3H8_9LACO|nr:hypothetical protein [Pediococcus inopinatus]WPC19282.1 hypothetical protein N6G95_08605 [Pediococcus inopinatus]WPC21072.1 hypothetical protein N6G96_07180 [Pediococcus inopinatus]
MNKISRTEIKLPCFQETINVSDNYRDYKENSQILIINQNTCWIKNKKKRTQQSFNFEDLKNVLKFSNYSDGYTTTWSFENIKVLKALGYELTITKIKK